MLKKFRPQKGKKKAIFVYYQNNKMALFCNNEEKNLNSFGFFLEIYAFLLRTNRALVRVAASVNTIASDFRRKSEVHHIRCCSFSEKSLLFSEEEEQWF